MASSLRFASALVALGGGLLASFGGCNGEDCEAQGGVTVEVEGETVCEGKCEPSSCVTDNTCVGNRCRLRCDAHSDCFSALEGDAVNQGCYPVQTDSETGLNDGEIAFICVESMKTPDAGRGCPGGDECAAYSACPDGTPCVPGSAGACPAEQCKPLTCQNQGDDTFCTTVDCTKDDDCAPGFGCGVVRLENKICGTTKGSEEPCIDPANNAATGATFQEGPTSLLRNACVKREPCSPCASDVDCADAGMSCVTIGGGTFCAKPCTGDAECPRDFTCSAESVCVPRSGTCKPPATDNFCFNCLTDLDCGPAGPDSTVGCEEFFDGQRGCFDFSFSTTCVTDEDCPASPSGARGQCLDEGEGVPPGNELYQKCFAPFDPVVQDYQCWPG
jgi:hypothetical protein